MRDEQAKSLVNGQTLCQLGYFTSQRPKFELHSQSGMEFHCIVSVKGVCQPGNHKALQADLLSCMFSPINCKYVHRSPQATLELPEGQFGPDVLLIAPLLQ